MKTAYYIDHLEKSLNSIEGEWNNNRVDASETYIHVCDEKLIAYNYKKSSIIQNTQLILIGTFTH